MNPSLILFFLFYVGTKIAISQFVQRGNKITGVGSVTAAQFGAVVSLSSDGDTAAVLGPADNSPVGAAWVFSNSTQFANPVRLVPTGRIGSFPVPFPSGLAISSDGSTVFVGDAGDNNAKGAVYAFHKNGTQFQKISPSGSVGSRGHFGISIAIKNEILAIGSFTDDYNGGDKLGAVYILKKNGDIYSQVQKIVPPAHYGYADTPALGFSLDLSNDATTLVAGASQLDIGVSVALNGGVFIYSQNASGSYVLDKEFVGEPDSYLGFSVSISGDGNLVASGGQLDNYIRVFSKSSGVWKSLQLITNFPATCVSLSPSGNFMAIGVPSDSGNTGAVYVYSKNSSNLYELYQGKITPSGFTGTPEFGTSVAMQSSSLLVGGSADNTNNGAAWGFNEPITRSPTTPPSTSPSKNPSTSKPSKNPTTSKPTTSPVSSKPTSSPSKSKPTISPSISKPTIAPTQSKPTKAPSVSSPTKNPTKTPTKLPTSQTPTRLPTTFTPTFPKVVATAAPGPAFTNKVICTAWGDPHFVIEYANTPNAATMTKTQFDCQESGFFTLAVTEKFTVTVLHEPVRSNKALAYIREVAVSSTTGSGNEISQYVASVSSFTPPETPDVRGVQGFNRITISKTTAVLSGSGSDAQHLGGFAASGLNFSSSDAKFQLLVYLHTSADQNFFSVTLTAFSLSSGICYPDTPCDGRRRTTYKTPSGRRRMLSDTFNRSSDCETDANGDIECFLPFREECAGAGLSGAFLDACHLDVAATNDTAFVASSLFANMTQQNASDSAQTLFSSGYQTKMNHYLLLGLCLLIAYVSY